ncbi:MAG: hypothetical protein APR63_01380 [Desulfuromonas sp. SDB]|nr:MAG: hypothetical protein APR63_01380 [Desulfuromonas sp. SDB]
MIRKLSALLVLVVFILSACSGGGASSPSAAVEGFAQAIKDGDVKKAVDYMSDGTVENMSAMFDMFIEMAAEDPDAAAEMEKELGISIDELKGMEPRERLATILENTGEEDMFGEMGEFEIVSEEIDGDEAVVTIKTGDGEEEEITLIKENGAWKIDIAF